MGATAPSLDVGHVVLVIFAVGISGDFTKNGFLLSTTDPDVFTVIKPGVAKAGKIAVI